MHPTNACYDLIPQCKAAVQRGIQACSNAMHNEEKPSLLSPEAETHVLDGDSEGGEHAPGAGIPGKSEFPEDWSRGKILGEISDVATDPDSSTSNGREGTTVVVGTRDGVKIQVIIGSDGSIVTGYPKSGPGVTQNRR